jgi:hypothetical protein
VADKLCSFIAATAMPLGQFVKYTRDRKISFGIISLPFISLANTE